MLFANKNNIEIYTDYDKLHPEFIKKIFVLNEMDLKGFEVTNNTALDGKVFRVVSAWRSRDQQQKLYESYQAGGAIASAPGKSYHNYGLAIDIVFRVAGYDSVTVNGIEYDFSKPEGWIKSGIVEKLEAQGLTWGGRFATPDCGHFEWRTKVPLMTTFMWIPYWWKLNLPLVEMERDSIKTTIKKSVYKYLGITAIAYIGYKYVIKKVRKKSWSR